MDVVLPGDEARAKSERQPETEKAGSSNVASDAEEPMLWCPVCSTRLLQHRCKLVCEKCGYYMSCADYY